MTGNCDFDIITPIGRNELGSIRFAYYEILEFAYWARELTIDEHHGSLETIWCTSTIGKLEVVLFIIMLAMTVFSHNCD